MTYPEGPLWILGIPYEVLRCERVDRDNPDYTWKIDRAVGEIRIRDDMHPDLTRQYVTGAILLEALQLIDPKHKIDDDQGTAFACVLAGSLKTNPHLVAYLCGDIDEAPTELDLMGATWDVRQVPVIPGWSSDVAGQSLYHLQEILLREDSKPWRKRWVLLHEWCHSVADLGAVALRDDEAYIRTASTTVFETFVHNRDYMRQLYS